ncbi:hypothetical protein RLEG12_18585 [Rhizobium leguminosarum bv. trifolii CB782]|nr:hypothetical protein RLEG12_18585 [Rhizobium leguminosarum bv. trifolii CB782]
MLYQVVRPFPLSLDGLTLIDLDAGDEREDFGGMEAGLEAEGFIKPVGKKAAIEPQIVQPQVAPVAEPTKPVSQPKPRRQR